MELDASKVISNPESSSTYPETSVSEDQVLQPASTNSEFGSSAVNNDDSSSVGLQEDVPNRQATLHIFLTPLKNCYIKN